MTPIHLTSNYYGLPVPEGASDIRMNAIHNIIQWKEKGMEKKPYWDTQLLPPGSWRIVGIKLGEEEAKGIVESKRVRGGAFNSALGHYQSSGYTTFYKNYQHPEPSICIPNTAIESLSTLLRSKGLDENTLILKKE